MKNLAIRKKLELSPSALPKNYSIRSNL